MSEPRQAAPAMLFASLLARDDALIRQARRRLEEALGPVEEESPLFPFDWTDYYTPELGAPLVRRFVFFAELVPQDRLVPAKHLAWRVERELSRAGKRQVNIDPGLLLLERLVLATFKNFSHRIYLGAGVYAEVTLLFRHGRFEPLPWTYPDYASGEVRRLFARLRTRYREKLRHAG